MLGAVQQWTNHPLALGNLRGLPGAASTSSMLEHSHFAVQSRLHPLPLMALHSICTFLSAALTIFQSNPNTLSFYTVYMAHHIKLSSVDSYLSGICSKLKPFYPNVHKNHHLVTKTLWGCKKLQSIPTTHKQPLTCPELAELHDEYMSSNSHDNLLFFVILLVSFHALMHLGELVWPDKKALQNFQKVSTHDLVELLPKGFAFFLPGHKADHFFEGNRIIFQCNSSGDDPDEPFCKYLKSHNLLFPFHPQLWLWEDGTIPMHSWFIHWLHHHFPSDIAGHSLCAGGATALAQAGIPPYIIQAIGRWASEAFQIYVHHHPVLLVALLCSSISSRNWFSVFPSYSNLLLLFPCLPTFLLPSPFPPFFHTSLFMVHTPNNIYLCWACHWFQGCAMNHLNWGIHSEHQRGMIRVQVKIPTLLPGSGCVKGNEPLSQ